MRSYDDCRKVDIKKCVERLREDRGGCVQTFEQYQYIYKVRDKWLGASLSSLGAVKLVPNRHYICKFNKIQCIILCYLLN